MDIDKIGEDIAMSYWARNNETNYSQIVDRVVNYLYEGRSNSDISIAKAMLMEKKFLPNSPCWMNAGTELKSLAACFVLPLEDNMESIFKTASDIAMVLKEGGGIGVALSPLREEGAQVKKTKGVSSGPISFLKVYDAVVETVKQGGTRLN